MRTKKGIPIGRILTTIGTFLFFQFWATYGAAKVVCRDDESREGEVNVILREQTATVSYVGENEEDDVFYSFDGVNKKINANGISTYQTADFNLIIYPYDISIPDEDIGFKNARMLVSRDDPTKYSMQKVWRIRLLCE